METRIDRVRRAINILRGKSTISEVSDPAIIDQQITAINQQIQNYREKGACGVRFTHFDSKLHTFTCEKCGLSGRIDLKKRDENRNETDTKHAKRVFLNRYGWVVNLGLGKKVYFCEKGKRYTEKPKFLEERSHSTFE